MNKFVYEIMRDAVKTVNYDDSLYACAKIMKEHKIGFIPVLKNNKVCGVITDRDIVIKGLGNLYEPESPVEKIMTKNVISCSHNASIKDCLNIMANNLVRRLVVFNDDDLVGVISIGDIQSDPTVDELTIQTMFTITKESRPRGKDPIDYVKIDDFKL